MIFALLPMPPGWLWVRAALCLGQGMLDIFIYVSICTQPSGPGLTCETGGDSFFTNSAKVCQSTTAWEPIVEEVPHTLNTTYHAHTGTCSTLFTKFSSAVIFQPTTAWEPIGKSTPHTQHCLSRTHMHTQHTLTHFSC